VVKGGNGHNRRRYRWVHGSGFGELIFDDTRELERSLVELVTQRDSRRGDAARGHSVRAFERLERRLAAPIDPARAGAAEARRKLGNLFDGVVRAAVDQAAGGIDRAQLVRDLKAIVDIAGRGRVGQGALPVALLSNEQWGEAAIAYDRIATLDM